MVCCCSHTRHKETQCSGSFNLKFEKKIQRRAMKEKERMKR